MTFDHFTTEQLEFILVQPYSEIQDELKRRTNPVDVGFFKSLKVGDCFLDAQLKHMYIYKITGTYEDFVTCSEVFINYETDDIDVYEDIDHSIKSTDEFKTYTKISVDDFDQFMTCIDQMNNRIDELYTGTVCEARDIFVKYI